MSVIDEYLQNINEPERSELKRIRKIVQSTIPEAVEVISYGMPAYNYAGRYLVGFNAFKDHLSLFPAPHAIDALKDRLGDYSLSKGTIRFNLEKPLPESLIKEILLALPPILPRANDASS